MKNSKRLLVSVIVALLIFVSFLVHCGSNPPDMSPEYTIAAYYFPNYHPTDDRHQVFHGAGWSEWELVRNARPRFPGHRQPVVPLWRYTDESDPEDMAQKIDAAADHGIDAFIFDWYYYDDGPFLEKALEQGFFGAHNNDRIKFSLMWANHDWKNIHPVTKQELLAGPEILYPGKISKATWEKMTDYIIETYFKHPSYWLIDGEPYFSIYDLSEFMAIFGSVQATAEAVEKFRTRVKEAGFPDLNFNAVVWGRTILPGEQRVENIERLIRELGFDSFTSYVWIHHVRLEEFPQTPYKQVQEKYFEYARAVTDTFDLPYYPNVTMGWDSSPRAHQDDELEPVGYPFMASMGGNTPAAFEEALRQMKTFMDSQDISHRIFNINCWNEWTEGSYLEPDTTHGMAYLQAIRAVFGSEKRKNS